MQITRALPVFDPRSGDRKYIKIEFRCHLCGHVGQAHAEELAKALEKTKGDQLKFKCSVCGGPEYPRIIHKKWFDWHSQKPKIFPPWHTP